MRVILGSNLGENNAEGYTYKVRRVVIHPNCSRLKGHPELQRRVPRFFNDIALLELDREISFDEKVKALEIPQKGFSPLEYSNKALVVGWGVTESGEMSPNLQKANVDIRSDLACYQNDTEKGVYGVWHVMNGLEEQLLCMGGMMEGKWSPVAGRGDSGGPAICRGADGRPLLCGVTSFGSTGYCDETSDERRCAPSGYAEVSYFRDWIRSHAGGQNSSTLHQPYLYGKPVPRGVYPHQVHITSLEGKQCGGTLITQEFVVTAAHCVMSPDRKSRRGIKVIFGIKNVRGKGRVFAVAAMKALPGFHRVGKEVDIARQGSLIWIVENFYRNDLALLKLDGKVNISRDKLPEIPSANFEEFGVELAFPLKSELTTQILSREFRFLLKAECQTRLRRFARSGKGKNITLDEDLLCGVEVYSGGSTCDRELGGGVIYKGANGKDVLCGVQIFRLCEFSVPNGFLDMTLYKDWVEETMTEL